MSKRLYLCFFLLTLLGSSALAYDRSEFLFLDEVEIGMKGIGRTIIAGDVIEEFAAEILGVIDQAGTLSDFIVVQVSGDVIGRAGGIAQGMSGSPVYVDGKLIGALSRSANWSKAITPIGLVTPIEPMLAVLDEARSDIAVSAPTTSAVLAEINHVLLDHAPSEFLVASMPNTLFSYPVSTPIITAGLSGRSLDVLMSGQAWHGTSAKLVTEVLGSSIQPEVRGLSALGLTLLPLAGSSTAGTADAGALVAGGSVGVALASGDISIGSLGTITYRDGESLIAYGHPFISNGTSSFPLTSVSVIDTMKSLQASFKLGTLGDSLGTILEDRTAAIAGQLGPVARLIDLTWALYDADRNVDATFSVGLVDEPRLMPELLLSTGFEAIDTTLDRVGQGTVEVAYKIYGDNMPFPLERGDVFFSSTDVAIYAPWQLASIVSFLQYNAFQDPGITKVVATMHITQEIKGIQIAGLHIDNPYYAPGDTIIFEVALQTFQGTSEVRVGTLQIPEDLPSDIVVIRAYGGPRYLEDGEIAPEFGGLEDLVDAIEQIPSYDTLTVELFAVDVYSADPTALFGVTEQTFVFPGHAVYDAWEITVPLLSGSVEEDSTSDESIGGPGW